MSRSTMAAMAALLTGAFVAPPAHADNPRLNVQIFRPGGHPGDLFTVLRSDGQDEMQWGVGLSLVYGKNPLVFVDTRAQPNQRDEVMQDQLTLDLYGSFAPVEWLDISLDIPLFLMNEGEPAGFTNGTGPNQIDKGAIQSFALGDVRLSAKFSIIDRKDDEDGFGLGAEARFGFPTGESNSFVSDGFSMVPTLIVDGKLGILYLGANLGARIRTERAQRLFLDVQHEFIWRAGVGVDIVEDLLQGIGELYGASDFENANNTNMEGVIGARLLFPDEGVSVSLGGGSGVTKGYGNTKFRLFLQAGYSPPVIKDADEDGILDEVDKCPLQPEDKDNFEDEDGCPDDDNDKDGIKDGSDRCPNDPEDIDGYQDDDGCPDKDNDGDGIPDDKDRCPMQPEDKDGFQDTDGCPDLDNDQDRIPDLKDKCPNEAEIYNGFEDEDGCPDETLASVDKGKIIIKDKVYFATGKATIKEQSFPVLNAVAGILKANPHIKGVRVEGHTDDVGSSSKNLKLSDARANSVREFLIKAGIAGDRMTAQGFGESQAAVEGKTKQARAANRRVEFIITAQ